MCTLALSAAEDERTKVSEKGSVITDASIAL